MLILGTHVDPGKGLVAIPPKDCLKHTVVIGQSGSGKSYFLARYLEELALRTKIRIVILDPNGDFTNFWKPQSELAWADDAFQCRFRQLEAGTVQLGDASFDTKDAFEKAWTSKTFQFATAGRDGRTPLRTGAYTSPLILHWGSLGSEQDFFLNINPIQYPNIHQGTLTCFHFVARHPELYPRGVSLQDLEDVASSFAEGKIAPAEYPEALTLSPADWVGVRLAFRRVRKSYYRLWHPDALKGQLSVPTDLLGYLNRGFTPAPPWQVAVAGLSGLDSQHMALAANAALHRLWQLSLREWKTANDTTLVTRASSPAPVRQIADPEDDDVLLEDSPSEATASSPESPPVQSYSRVPTLVVVDEAHNFAPANPASELQARVSDKVALIAAEGRKYGLFLLLATQRPQKLRHGLLQECENACLLRIQSGVERASAAEALGVPKETVDQIGNFHQQGQALLLGRWVTGGYNNCFFAPSRTVLGGTGIVDKDWLA